MKFKLSIISLPPERHSALGLFFALCSQAASSSVLTCRFLPYSSCRSLLLCGLAVDSLGRGWSCYPLWISRILLFFWLMPGLTSSRPQVLKAGTMPSSPGSSCQPSAASTLFLDPSAFHIPVWAPPQAHSPCRGDSFILIKSFLAPVTPLLPWHVIFDTSFSVLSAREHFSKSPLYWITI